MSRDQGENKHDLAGDEKKLWMTKGREREKEKHMEREREMRQTDRQRKKSF